MSPVFEEAFRSIISIIIIISFHKQTSNLNSTIHSTPPSQVQFLSLLKQNQNIATHHTLQDTPHSSSLLILLHHVTNHQNGRPTPRLQHRNPRPHTRPLLRATPIRAHANDTESRSRRLG